MLDIHCTNIAILVEYRKQGIQHLLLLIREPEAFEDYEVCYDLPIVAIDPYEEVYGKLHAEIERITGFDIPVIEGEKEMKHYQARGHRAMTYRSFCSVQSIDERSQKPYHLEVLRCKAEGDLSYVESNPDRFLLLNLNEIAFMIEDAPERFNPFMVNAIKRYLKSAGYIVKASED